MLFLGGCGGDVSPVTAPPIFTITQNDGYTYHRIPSALVVNNRVLVVAERRFGTAQDWADTKIDIFEAYPKIRLLSTIDMGKAILSNPQPILANNTLVILFIKRPSKTGGIQMCDGSVTVEAHAAISEDHGLTWSIKNIHSRFKRPGARQTYVSPTHGYYKNGFMYAAGYASFKHEQDCAHRTYEGDRSFVVRSIDLVTWETVVEAPPGTNEMAFTMDSVIMMWSRTYWPTTNRVITINGSTKQYPPHMPVVHSGIISNRVFYPELDNRERLVSNNLEGTDRTLIYDGHAGYSNAIEYNDQTFVVFENGDVKFNERISGVFLE